MENLLKFFDDKIIIHVIRLISVIRKFYPLLYDESRVKFKINLKIDEIKKGISSGKISDKELEIVNILIHKIYSFLFFIHSK